jgi:hypothetical protein
MSIDGTTEEKLDWDDIILGMKFKTRMENFGGLQTLRQSNNVAEILS